MLIGINRLDKMSLYIGVFLFRILLKKEEEKKRKTEIEKILVITNRNIIRNIVFSSIFIAHTNFRLKEIKFKCPGFFVAICNLN